MNERADPPRKAPIDKCDAWESDEVPGQTTRDPDKEGHPSFPVLRMQQRHIGAVVRPLG